MSKFPPLNTIPLYHSSLGALEQPGEANITPQIGSWTSCHSRAPTQKRAHSGVRRKVANIASESVSNFIPESTANLPRYTHCLTKGTAEAPLRGLTRANLRARTLAERTLCSDSNFHSDRFLQMRERQAVEKRRRVHTVSRGSPIRRGRRNRSETAFRIRYG